MYAQLDFTNNKYKRVNLIGGEEVGITNPLIEQYPSDFVNLDGRESVPVDTMDWYYDSENDIFLQTADLPECSPEPAPHVPSNIEIAQILSDLQADLIIAGVI